MSLRARAIREGPQDPRQLGRGDGHLRELVEHEEQRRIRRHAGHVVQRITPVDERTRREITPGVVG